MAVDTVWCIWVIILYGLTVKTASINFRDLIMAIAAVYSSHGIGMWSLHHIGFLMTGNAAIVSMDRPHELLPVNSQLDRLAFNLNSQIRICMTVEAILISHCSCIPRKTCQQQYRNNK